MHFQSVGRLNVWDAKLKGKMVPICQCITLLRVLLVKLDTLTEILPSHYTHFTLKSLQCSLFLARSASDGIPMAKGAILFSGIVDGDALRLAINS